MSERSRPEANDGRPVAPTSAADFGLDQVRQAIRGIRFGEVRVVIQDGVVVRIERVEKQRLR